MLLPIFWNVLKRSVAVITVIPLGHISFADKAKNACDVGATLFFFCGLFYDYRAGAKSTTYFEPPLLSSPNFLLPHSTQELLTRGSVVFLLVRYFGVGFLCQ